jgi:hypothetical protein
MADTFAIIHNLESSFQPCIDATLKIHFAYRGASDYTCHA